MIKSLIYDLQTGGLDYKSNPILQFTGTFLEDERIVDYFDFLIKPDPEQIVEQAALDVNKIDLTKAKYTQKQLYSEILAKLDRRCFKFNRQDKLWLVGYNNVAFDNKFFQELFKRNENNYFYAYFWGSIDLMILCNSYFSNYRQFLPNLKLKNAAKLLGVDVEEDSLHNSAYDVYLTTQIYFKLLEENKLQLQYSDKIKEKLLEN